MMRVLRSNPALPLLIVILGIMVYLSPLYSTAPGMMGFLQRAAPLVILTCGTSFVLISGGFDLSTGSLITLVVIGCAMITQGDPSTMALAIALVSGIGLLVGLVNGFVVTKLKVPSIIATLGSLLSLKGLAMIWAGGAPSSSLPDNLRFLGRSRIHDVPLLDGLPIAVIVLVVVIALTYWLLHRTNFGRMVFMLGIIQKPPPLPVCPRVLFVSAASWSRLCWLLLQGCCSVVIRAFPLMSGRNIHFRL